MTALDTYLRKGTRELGRFLDDYSAHFIARLSGDQTRDGVVGAVGEIGVHQGGLFILMVLTKTDEEKAFAVDLFENDEINVRLGSPRSVQILESNLGRWAPGAASDGVGIIKSSSYDVKPSDLVSEYGRVRLLSVDGGHDEQTVLHDLSICDEIMDERGVVIIDDYFNERWPGVSSACARYLLDPATKFRPFAISPNKVYMACHDQTERYRERARSRESAFFDKTQMVFGHDVDIYRDGTGQPLKALKSFVGRTPLRGLVSL